MPPELVAPVEPDVPLLLLVPADPPVDGVVTVELPDAPMPELVPDDDVPLLGDEDADDEPDGVESEPVAEPPVDPMPDAVPDALPDAVDPQATSAAVQITGIRTFNIVAPCADEENPSGVHHASA